jgi:hypothetical protein
MDTLRIALTKGQFAVIEAADSWMDRYRWNATEIRGRYYAYAKLDGRMTYMHRLLMGNPPKMEVDHKNGDTLDNRRSNLRIVTHAQNLANQRLHVRSASGFKGVSWDKKSKKWAAHIKYQCRKRHLGYFAVKEDAARAYNAAATELFGEYARLNPL